MKKLGKGYKNTESIIDSEEEQRGLLPSSEVSVRCSSLDVNGHENEFASEEAAIEYLADILVDIFLSKKNE